MLSERGFNKRGSEFLKEKEKKCEREGRKKQRVIYAARISAFTYGTKSKRKREREREKSKHFYLSFVRLLDTII